MLALALIFERIFHFIDSQAQWKEVQCHKITISYHTFWWRINALAAFSYEKRSISIKYLNWNSGTACTRFDFILNVKLKQGDKHNDVLGFHTNRLQYGTQWCAGHVDAMIHVHHFKTATTIKRLRKTDVILNGLLLYIARMSESRQNVDFVVRLS